MTSAVPRPRPRPVPRAKAQPAATSSNAPIPVDDDDMFIRNKSRSMTTWQKFDAIDNASKKKAARSDTDDDSDSPRPKKQSKTKTLQAAHAEMRRMLSKEPSSDSDSDIVEFLNETRSKQKKRKGKERSRSRSLTPPPALPEHQLRNARNIVRQTLDSGRSRSPTPPPEVADQSVDTIEYAPEIQKILRAAQPKAVREELTESNTKENIELRISWKSHPKDSKPHAWQEPVTWRIEREANFRTVMEAVADEASIRVANLVLSYNHARVFPSASPASLNLWHDAELEACEKGTWDYLRLHPTTNVTIAASPVKRKPAVIEDESGVLVVSDTDDASIMELDADQADSDSDTGDAGDTGGNEDNDDGTFKIHLRSKLTEGMDISLTVRATTTCGAIVRAFLKKAGLADKYPTAGASGSKGPRKSVGKGKGKKGAAAAAAAAPQKEPKLEIDGERMADALAIGEMQVEDGDVMDVVL
ncbi:hypothetical protein C8F01DRAFT_1113820 [Mycena amicta]|nr:hypothetical protein C8F01DRAFT_1113820 [Mycena amicta]